MAAHVAAARRGPRRIFDKKRLQSNRTLSVVVSAASVGAGRPQAAAHATSLRQMSKDAAATHEVEMNAEGRWSQAWRRRPRRAFRLDQKLRSV